MELKTEGKKLLYTGKTKDVYEADEGKVLLKTKDAITGWWHLDANGNKDWFEVDPGGNEIIGDTKGVWTTGENGTYFKFDLNGKKAEGDVKGLGNLNLASSKYYFELFTEAGLPTHYVDCDLDNNLMLAHKITPIGKDKICLIDGKEYSVQGLECIVRFKARGSLLRRNPGVYQDGEELNDFFEITLKDDLNNDPPVKEEELINSGIMNAKEFEEFRNLCLRAAKLMRADIADLGCSLDDLKFEVAYVNGKIALIDEISAGIMRVYLDGVQLEEEELANTLVTRVTPRKEELKKFGK